MTIDTIRVISLLRSTFRSLYHSRGLPSVHHCHDPILVTLHFLLPLALCHWCHTMQWHACIYYVYVAIELVHSTQLFGWLSTYYCRRRARSPGGTMGITPLNV